MRTPTGNMRAAAEFLSGKLEFVEVEKIERELKTLWQYAGKSEDGEPTVTRACSMNIILFVPATDIELQASDVLDEITLKHPCRALLAMSRESEVETLEAWVSARCHPVSGKRTKQICCEQIVVRWVGGGVEELASVVMPLVIHDLPVVMWWRVPTLRRDYVERFVDGIDRLVVDSLLEEDTLEFYKDLCATVNDYKKELVVADLNWRRLLPWRQSIAWSFEALHGGVETTLLKSIESVNIKYAVKKESTVFTHLNQTLHCIGWLASRLKWTPTGSQKTDDSEFDVRFDASGNKVVVNVQPMPCDVTTEGNIVSIEITLSDGTVINSCQQPGAPVIDSSVVHPCDKAANGKKNGKGVFLTEPTQRDLIDEELYVESRDRVFEESLEMGALVLSFISDNKESKSKKGT